MKICAIVIWYNPNENMWKNIERYLPFVNKCIIVDNSKRSNINLIKSEIKKIIYITNKDNFGIAKALNQGCELAQKMKFDWVLTMDQDCYFEKKEIVGYFKEAKRIHKKDNKSVSFSPNWNSSPIKKNEKVDSVITSGNLLKLDAWKKIGKFNEKLFIYLVDTFFGYSLKREGFMQYQIKNIKMKWNVFDDYKTKKILRKKIILRINENPNVKYYIARNYLELKKVFPEYQKDLFFIYRLVLKIILFEKNKVENLKMIWRGYRDFKKGKFGKLNQ